MDDISFFGKFFIVKISFLRMLDSRNVDVLFWHFEHSSCQKKFLKRKFLTAGMFGNLTAVKKFPKKEINIPAVKFLNHSNCQKIS